MKVLRCLLYKFVRISYVLIVIPGKILLGLLNKEETKIRAQAKLGFLSVQ